VRIQPSNKFANRQRIDYRMAMATSDKIQTTIFATAVGQCENRFHYYFFHHRFLSAPGTEEKILGFGFDADHGIYFGYAICLIPK